MNASNAPAWVMALLTAALFGVTAFRGRSSVSMWVLTGGLLGLLVTAICLGLANAATVPYAIPQIVRQRWDAIGAAVCILGFVEVLAAMVTIRGKSAR